MTETRTVLTYIAANEIQRQVSDRPVIWHAEDRKYSRQYGDQAGATPTPAVGEFFNQVADIKTVPEQNQYANYCSNIPAWGEWLPSLTKGQLRGVLGKLRWNFYPSCVATLHAWALLVESGRFDRCFLDTAEDAVGKIDLTVFKDDTPVTLGLRLDSPYANQWRQYKNRHRKGDGDAPMFEVLLPYATRKKGPGNMRWYVLEDFRDVLDYVNPGVRYPDEPIPLCSCGSYLQATEPCKYCAKACCDKCWPEHEFGCAGERAD